MKIFIFFTLILFYSSLSYTSDIQPSTVKKSNLKSSVVNKEWTVWEENEFQRVKYRPVFIENKALIEISASVTIKSSLSAFIYFLEAVDETPNWLINASESKFISRQSLQENQFYIAMNKLWPLRARILILHSTYWQNSDLSIEIDVTDITPKQVKQENLLPKIDLDSFLHVKVHDAHWKIIPKLNHITNEKEIFIEYVYTADGRGKAPKWIADHFALKSIWKSIRNMRRELPNQRWQQQTIKGITELPLKISE